MTAPQGTGSLGYEISGMIRACNAMQPYKRPDCPKCGWEQIEVSIDGLHHCKFCGNTFEFYITRDVGRPKPGGL